MLEGACYCRVARDTAVLQCLDDGEGIQQLRLPDGTLLDENETFELVCTREDIDGPPIEFKFAVPEPDGMVMLLLGVAVLAFMCAWMGRK